MKQKQGLEGPKKRIAPVSKTKRITRTAALTRPSRATLRADLPVERPRRELNVQTEDVDSRLRRIRVAQLFLLDELWHRDFRTLVHRRAVPRKPSDDEKPVLAVLRMLRAALVAYATSDGDGLEELGRRSRRYLSTKRKKGQASEPPVIGVEIRLERSQAPFDPVIVIGDIVAESSKRGTPDGRSAQLAMIVRDLPVWMDENRSIDAVADWFSVWMVSSPVWYEVLNAGGQLDFASAQAAIRKAFRATAKREKYVQGSDKLQNWPDDPGLRAKLAVRLLVAGLKAVGVANAESWADFERKQKPLSKSQRRDPAK